MISKLEVLAIGLYQKVSHPIYSVLDKVSLNPVHCKYTPSCSEYAMEAIVKYGAIKGTKLAVKRICRCGPGQKGGQDPLV